MFAVETDWATAVLQTVVSGGFAGSLVVYLIAKGIPDLQKRFADSEIKIQKSYTEAQKEQREDFQKMLAVERDQMTKLASIVMDQRLAQLDKIKDKVEETSRDTEIILRMMSEMRDNNNR